MKVENMHEREYDTEPELVGALIDSLSSRNDRLWPFEKWPSLCLDKSLSVGAPGGHGSIRYYVEHYVPSRSVTFRFLTRKSCPGLDLLTASIRRQ